MNILNRITSDGPERLCRGCVNRGYEEDAWQPKTSQYWPTIHGKLWFGRCLACNADRKAGKHGVVPGGMRMVA